MAKFNNRFVSILMACTLCYSTLAMTQVNVHEVIHTRQQGFKDMGAALKTVRDQLRQSSPDMTAIKTAGETIKATAPRLATWFPKGSGTEAGIKTAAKPEIWSDANTFEQKRSDLVTAVETFARLTASGDKAAITAGVAPLSRTCKSCHDSFFEDDK